MFECIGGNSFKNLCKRDTIKLVLYDTDFNGKRVYTPGSDVCGECIVNLSGEINLRQLEIKLKGKARVCWTEGRVTRSAAQKCLQLNYYHKGSNYYTRIARGEHRIPFSIRLPDNLLNNIPSSFEGEYGSIRYHLKAEIRKPETLLPNQKTQIPVTIKSPANVEKHLLMARRARHEEKTVGFCFPSGYVSLKCETSYGQFVGTNATIVCNAENRSNSVIILKAKLIQITLYIDGLYTREDKKKITTIVGSHIQPNSSINESLSLKIPPELPVSMNQCPLIYINYHIVVTVYIPNAFNLHACLPIIVTYQT